MNAGSTSYFSPAVFEFTQAYHSILLGNFFHLSPSLHTDIFSCLNISLESAFASLSFQIDYILVQAFMILRIRVPAGK